METIAQIKEQYRTAIARSRQPLFSSVCTFCAHYQLDRTCPAFPGGIPDEIWLGRNGHTAPYPGDNGIQFERVEAAQAA
jgi:hypothetical protein